MTHVLVTNDYPPKTGGIQSYLWELWRRLPAGETVVLTARGPSGAAARSFDRAERYPIVRTRAPVLLPTPGLARTIRTVAADAGAGLVLLDPALPLGMLGPSLGLPYGVVLHGAEVTVPGRLPAGRPLLARVLRHATLIVAAGGYPAREARRAAGDELARTVIVPPGVDSERFRPLDPAQRRAARLRHGLPADGRLIVSVSRLVPRKGMDVLIEAAARLGRTRPDLTVAIGGKGRDARRLSALVRRTGAPVRLLGFVPEVDLPALDGAADVWAMICRNRWGGLEQEGFGIVFLEAAATGVPQVAGRSGGADEAVVDGETGTVVDHPDDPAAVTLALARLLDDEELRVKMGTAARERVAAEFDYDVLGRRLLSALVDAAH
jgi:phosphatidylinositol alpha-1,6-mannosyltransferase